MKTLILSAALALGFMAPSVQAEGQMNDLEIAHTAYTAGLLMGWMAPASTGVAMRHNAGVKNCL